MIASCFAQSGIDFETCLLPPTSNSSKQRQSLAPQAASAHPDRFTSSLEYIVALDISLTLFESVEIIRPTCLGGRIQDQFLLCPVFPHIFPRHFAEKPPTSINPCWCPPLFLPLILMIMFSHHSMLTAQWSLLSQASEISRPFTSTSSFVEGCQSYKPEASSWDTQRLAVTALANKHKTVYTREAKNTLGAEWVAIDKARCTETQCHLQVNYQIVLSFKEIPQWLKLVYLLLLSIHRRLPKSMNSLPGKCQERA